MGLLGPGCAAASALVLAGCYAPSVRDCTVSCASPGDCTGGQICGADGLCAAPALAGRCRMIAPDAPAPDDALPPRDAGDGAPGDAADLDASQTVILHVQITGRGSVIVDGSGVCRSRGHRRASCLYDVAAGVPVTVHAIELKPDDLFAGWTSVTCADQGARCVFTPLTQTSITARFERD